MADADGNEYGPFDVEVPGSQAEPFTEANWHDLDRSSGVLEGFGISFDGRTAQLAPGFARVHGSWLRRRAQWTRDSPATTTSAPRRDLLVLRRALTVGEGEAAVPGTVLPVVLAGTPATIPADPVFDPETDEPLWSWQMPGSGGSMVTGIRDLRRAVQVVPVPRTTGCTLTTNWSSPPGHSQQVYRDASGLIRLTGWMQNDLAFTIGGAETPLIVPDWAKPAAQHRVLLPNSRYASPATAVLRTDGVLQLERGPGQFSPASYFDLSLIAYHPTSTA